MKLAKRIITFLLACFMLVGMSACSDGEKSEEASKEESSVVSSATESEVQSDASQTDASQEETSKSEDEIIDKEGYEQFKALAEVDSSLSKRGFKDKGANADYKPLNYDVMKAVWISQFDFGDIYCNGSSQRSKTEFITYVSKAFSNLVSMGFNTVIVQTRPNADSFYPSAYYPWSHYVMGSYGKMGKYDPLEIMIEEAHKKNLSFHAWINPMRGMSPSDLSKTNKAYPLSKWKSDGSKKDYLYTYNYNGLCYLNISYEEVRNVIINGAAELVRNYDVDGVHMDDYFYFGEEEDFDKKAFNAAKAEKKSLTLQKFRYNNLNLLVSGIYSAVKEENKNVIFGISPAGNVDDMPTKYYADVKTWLSREGYVDYIMPQIYFGMQHSTWSFPYTYKRWTELIKTDKIKFIPGVTFIKAGKEDKYAGNGKNEWIEHNDVVKRSLEFCTKQKMFDGFAVFSYTNMWNPLTGERADNAREEVDNCKEYFTTKIKGEVIKY